MLKNLPIFLSFLFISLLAKPIFTEEESGWRVASIGFTFKSVAKSYLAVADINKLKKNGIDKLIKMTDEEFKKQYATIYPSLKDLPPHIRIKYGIFEKMTKRQAIKSISRLDRKQLCEIIDSVPNSAIAEQFKRAMSGSGKSKSPGSLTDQVSGLWKKVTSSLEGE